MVSKYISSSGTIVPEFSKYNSFDKASISMTVRIKRSAILIEYTFCCVSLIKIVSDKDRNSCSKFLYTCQYKLFIFLWIEKCEFNNKLFNCKFET